MLANRLARRSVRQVFDIPMPAADETPASTSKVSLFDRPQLNDDALKVHVAAIPSPDRNCRHHLFVDDGTRLKKLDLPSTTCVVVSQKFEASAGDKLVYDYVVRLNSTSALAAGRPAVRAVLVNQQTELAVSLMDRSLGGLSDTDQSRAGSRFTESQSFTVPTTGHYELRFITFVDRDQPDSEAKLLVNSVRVVNAFGRELKRLASLSCVGRVRTPAPDDSVN
jgi:hypothetical protein